MTAKITIERTGRQTARITLVADIQIVGSLGRLPHQEADSQASGSGPREFAAVQGNSRRHDLLTVEEAAEILHVGRDKAYYLIRTGQLRSIKIGKLRRVSRVWIAELVERLEAESG
jgi:excisionase family DNA binding protein